MSEKALLNHELLKAKMHRTEFPVRILSVSPRTLSYWQEHGLVEKQMTRKHRNFSFLDCIWIQILNDLQQFKVGTATIKSIKTSLFEGETPETNLFLQNCLFAIELKLPIYIIINKQGTAWFVNDRDIIDEFKKEPVQHLFVLNLNQVIRATFIQLWDSPLFERWSSLTKDELELLKMVRARRFFRITIKLNDSDIIMIEGTEKGDVEKRIIEYMKEERFQTIELKQQDGTVAVIHRTIKRKLN